STHLYCVLPNDRRTAAGTSVAGIAGAPVRALTIDGLVAWVSDVPNDLPLTIELVRAHDAVVESALAVDVTPAPVRFGQRFKNDDAARDALAKHVPGLTALVNDVQGYVEMTLVLTPSTQRMLRD